MISDRVGPIFSIFEENEPIFMNFLSSIQSDSVKTNAANVDLYT